MIYLWEKPRNCPNKLIAEYDRALSPDRFLFRRGTFIAQDQLAQKAIFHHDMSVVKLEGFDCIPNNSASPLVNERIVDILKELCPKDIQLIDAEVHCKDGILTNYKLLNITTTVVGLDHDKSVYKTDGTAISSISYGTYKMGCMDEHHIARDEEWKGNILVTESIKSAFEQKKIKGHEFVTPEDYYTSIYGHP
ncbi:imm11 family protein [Legionella worsleiensis]|uniref:Immunity MXAN-0049 protein domain-containing protein n=1 Tax=Legionella worsleiensis TaxID=45076 RepID=A0A0W1AL72_9GAMM|nr:DUF1629 domain-containing protein [Legionella worsleiensis]KTD82084.1 hypothetical protein Lwor_0004 [Legionella worsleiensis]STY31497.1 Uncharacterised protein [Legionella worsleiensis]